MPVVSTKWVVEELMDGLNRPYTLRWPIERWVNGPYPGFDQVEYMGNGRWEGPRAILFTRRNASK